MFLTILLVLTTILILEVECKYCWHTTSYGKTSHFYCGAFEYCCEASCCANFDQFYRLWYFWLCILVLLMSCGIALYWLKKRYLVRQLFTDDRDERRRARRRRTRRYRQLSGDPNNTSPPTVIIPDSVSFSPPPYSGDNTGVPHPGPPPYSLGSGSSINSTTLPRCPPPYQQIAKEPPPSYSSSVSLSPSKEGEKKNNSAEDSR